MSVKLEIKEETIGDVLVFRLKGSMDAATALALKETIFQRSEKGNNKIVVVFQSETYVTSTTVGILLSSLRHLRMKDGDLRLAELGETNQKVFEIMGADRLMDVFETLDEALKSFGRTDRTN